MLSSQLALDILLNDFFSQILSYAFLWYIDFINISKTLFVYLF